MCACGLVVYDTTSDEDVVSILAICIRQEEGEDTDDAGSPTETA